MRSKTNKSPFTCVIDHFTNSPRARHKTRPVLAVWGHDTDVRGRSVFPAGITSVRHRDPDAAGKSLQVMFFLWPWCVFLSSGQSKVKALLLAMCEIYSQIFQTPQAEAQGLKLQRTPAAAPCPWAEGAGAAHVCACALGPGLPSAAARLREGSTAFSRAVAAWDVQKPGCGDLGALIYESAWAGPWGQQCVGKSLAQQDCACRLPSCPLGTQPLPGPSQPAGMSLLGAWPFNPG